MQTARAVALRMRLYRVEAGRNAQLSTACYAACASCCCRCCLAACRAAASALHTLRCPPSRQSAWEQAVPQYQTARQALQRGEGWSEEWLNWSCVGKALSHNEWQANWASP